MRWKLESGSQTSDFLMPPVFSYLSPVWVIRTPSTVESYSNASHLAMTCSGQQAGIEAQADPPITKQFDLREVMIPIRCNRHPWERAYLGVLDHPFFAITDRNGSFTISGVPAGSYKMAVWHEKYGEQVLEVSLKPNESRTVDISFSAGGGILPPSGKDQ